MESQVPSVASMLKLRLVHQQPIFMDWDSLVSVVYALVTS